MTFLIIVVLIVAGVIAYKNRVALLAKITGQPQSRIERRLNNPASRAAAPWPCSQSTSSRALRASNAADARRARSSTRRAKDSRWGLSRK